MAQSPDHTRPRHRVLVAVLLVLGTLVAFLATFSVWVNRQALNTDNWTNTSTKLLENKAIDEQLATFMVTQLYANVDVEAELAKALPPQAKVLAGPAAGGLRQLAQRVAERALAAPRFQALWAEANRSAHEALLKILDGGGSFASTGEGEVTLHLGTLVSEVGKQAGLPEALLEKVPPEAGELTVLKSEQISTAQKVAKLIRRLPVVLFVLLILLYGGAIYLAGDRRREALRSVGFGFAIAGILALLVRGVAGNTITGSLATTAAVEPAAEAAWEIGTSLLVTVAASAIAFGVLLVLGAWLAGSTAPARALRQEASPYFRERRAAAYAFAAGIWVLLIAWAPIAAFRKPLGILVFAALFALGTELLRRQALAEFPNEPLRSFSARFGTSRPFGRRHGRAAAEADDPLARIERLNRLRQEGALTDAEFEQEKGKILAAR
ncbi:MAG: SHOCT domain-containing protein [Solirubrobacterales bacterium]